MSLRLMANLLFLAYMTPALAAWWCRELAQELRYELQDWWRILK